MQELFIYMDDSGVLHRNSGDKFFVYAGYLFCARSESEEAEWKYLAAERKIYSGKRELKASRLKVNKQNFLNKNMRDYQAFACVVEIARVYDWILRDRHSIVRYKDYCAKLAIKTKIAELIDYGDISPAAQTTLRLFLDEQSLATNGFYRLDESIAAEFGYGVNNLRFGICHRALFDRPISVSLQLCDSSKNPLIRASDLLANAIYKKYNTEQKISVANRKLTQISLPTREVRFRS